MIRDEEKYMQAMEFRKRGFTYSEIAKIVGISKSTASAWLSKKAFSKRVAKDNAERAARDNVKRIGLVNKSRATERKARYAEALRSAETEYKHYKNNPLFVAGLMLYLADGDQKDPSRIRVSSTNAHQHRIFISFIQEFLGVQVCDIAFYLTLYDGMNEVEEMKWWSQCINVPVQHFGKTQFLDRKGSVAITHRGAGTTLIGNRVLKTKLLYWMERMAKEI